MTRKGTANRVFAIVRLKVKYSTSVILFDFVAKLNLGNTITFFTSPLFMEKNAIKNRDNSIDSPYSFSKYNYPTTLHKSSVIFAWCV